MTRSFSSCTTRGWSPSTNKISSSPSPSPSSPPRSSSATPRSSTISPAASHNLSIKLFPFPTLAPTPLTGDTDPLLLGLSGVFNTFRLTAGSALGRGLNTCADWIIDRRSVRVRRDVFVKFAFPLEVGGRVGVVAVGEGEETGREGGCLGG
jgi:hypothetical protein